MNDTQPRPAPDDRWSSPVDDVTYDLLQALTSKLEAIEAYQMYADDGSESAGRCARPLRGRSMCHRINGGDHE